MTKSACPANAPAVQEIGEPQDEKFFQLLGLYASTPMLQTTAALHLEACLPTDEAAEAVLAITCMENVVPDLHLCR